MSEFFSYLFAIFVITPLQAEVSERLQGINASELVQAGRECVTAEGPQLLQRAQDNWGWAVANALGVGAGLVDPVTLLPQGNENCRAIVTALAREEGGENS